MSKQLAISLSLFFYDINNLKKKSKMVKFNIELSEIDFVSLVGPSYLKKTRKGNRKTFCCQWNGFKWVVFFEWSTCLSGVIDLLITNAIIRSLKEQSIFFLSTWNAKSVMTYNFLWSHGKQYIDSKGETPDNSVR